ncbi:MAG: glycosyltransferase family 4 protein [Proteobacteria bacterium]|nr:glycosyltransferase family 4 protein [Pseudomonadota bacterium]
MYNNLILTQCFPPDIGGIENLVAGLAHALAQQQATTVFADRANSNTDTPPPYTLRRFGGIKTIRRRYKAFAAQRLTRSNNWRVFCDSWKSLEHYHPSPKSPPPPIIVLAHGSEYPAAPSPAKLARIQNTLQRADRILAVSRFTRARMKQCGVDIRRVEIWHPPINPPPPPDNNSGEPQQWQNKHPRLLTVGRLAERKGIDIALAAVARLKQQHPNIRYLIAGSGEQEKKLQQQTQELKLEANVQFLGAVGHAEKSALYASADLFLLPCRPVQNDVEGYGLVLVEAAYFGLPAVTGSAGGSAEAVQDGQTGILCDGADINAVTAAIEKLLDNKTRAIFSANCRQKAQLETWDKRISELL